MIRLFFLAIMFAVGLANAARADAPFSADEPFVSHSDVAYFFDSISFKSEEWRFELSKNSVGLTWRLSSKKREKDVVGTCKDGQTLAVPDGDLLLLSGCDYILAFEPRKPESFKLIAILKPRFSASAKNRTRKGVLLRGNAPGLYKILAEAK